MSNEDILNVEVPFPISEIFPVGVPTALSECILVAPIYDIGKQQDCIEVLKILNLVDYIDIDIPLGKRRNGERDTFTVYSFDLPLRFIYKKLLHLCSTKECPLPRVTVECDPCCPPSTACECVDGKTVCCFDDEGNLIKTCKK